MEKNSLKTLFNDRILLENSIFKQSKESLEIFKKKFSKFNKNLVQKIIFMASNYGSFSYKYLGDLMSLTGNISIEFNKTNYFSQYLYLRKIIENKNFIKGEYPSDGDIDFSIDDFENPVKENTIWWFIRNDDVTGLVKFLTDKKEELKLDEEFTTMNKEIFDVIDFTCYCGSLNILKYLIINDNQLDFYACRRAVQSGAENVIEFLISKDQKFDNLLDVAVEAHQNSLCRWLYENYSDKKLTLPFTIITYNTEMFLFFYEECKWDINLIPSGFPSCLKSAVLHDDIEIVSFLIKQGAIVYETDIEAAKQKDIKNILIQNFKQNSKTKNQQNSLFKKLFFLLIIIIFMFYILFIYRKMN